MNRSSEVAPSGQLGSPGTVFAKRSKEIHPAILADLRKDSKERSNVVEQVEEMMKGKSDSIADVVVIGGGPGGYVAAIRTAQLGGSVVLVEKADLGGVCLNRGCIPTKVMLSSADVYDLIANRSDDFGVKVDGVSLDYARVLARRDRVVKQLVSGVGTLMKSYKIAVLKGVGRLTARNTVEVELNDSTSQRVVGRNIIIATGSEPVTLSIPGLEGDGVWDSDGALQAAEPPKSILVIGGGYIGVEWGYMFRKFGSAVTLVEMLPQILPYTDQEVAGELRKILEKDGIRFLTGSSVQKVDQAGSGLVCTVVSGETVQQIEAEKILVAVGRRPVSSGLGLEEIGVSTDRGRVLVDDHMRTNVPGVYAIGDVVGGALLAHKASHEGVVAAENCMGKESRRHYRAVPGCIYTSPEVATVGLTEEDAKGQGIDYSVGRFHFRANGKALAAGEREGYVKLIADSKYGEVLGCHMIGPHVTDLIHEVVLAVEAEATVETIQNAIHAHPTLSEVVHEAALDVSGISLNKGYGTK